MIVDKGRICHVALHVVMSPCSEVCLSTEYLQHWRTVTAEVLHAASLLGLE